MEAAFTVLSDLAGFGNIAGGNQRNGYLQIETTGGDAPITSVTFRSNTDLGVQSNDSLIFDQLSHSLPLPQSRNQDHWVSLPRGCWQPLFITESEFVKLSESIRLSERSVIRFSLSQAWSHLRGHAVFLSRRP